MTRPAAKQPTPGGDDGSELLISVNGYRSPSNEEPQNEPGPPKRRRGRPRRDDAQRVVIAARYTGAEAAAVRDAAASRGVTRAAFVHEAVVGATGRPDPNRLGAEIRAERRQDVLRLAAQLTALLAELRVLRHAATDRDQRYAPTDRDLRRAVVTVDEGLAEVRDIRALLAQEAGR